MKVTASERRGWVIAGYRSGFTLVELLVVVAILALLLAVLLPSLGKARAQAKQTVCLAHLHALGTAVIMYGDDHNGQLPNGNPPGVVGHEQGTTAVLLALNTKYLKSPAVFRCAADHDPKPLQLVTADYDLLDSARLSYDFYSVWWLIQYGPRLSWIGQAPLAWDLKGGRATKHWQQNHGNRGGDVVFADGHADWQPQGQWDQDNWPHPADRFYRP